MALVQAEARLEERGPVTAGAINSGQMRERVKVPVPLFERIANAEAMVLGTIAEYSLPLSAAPVIVELAQTLALDKPALADMKLSRTAASYKMVQGLGHTFSERTFQRIRSSSFSINLDESTSNSNKKVLSILVSYFNQELKHVVVEHLGSFEVLKGTAYHLETALVAFFKDHQIPFSNMVSMMLDSCNVMRGSKSGLETRIRDKHCQNLLDIDGDSCHHIHNAAKKFAAPFCHNLEQLFTDLHTDHLWASDQVNYLMEVCEFMCRHQPTEVYG
ncbi:hypothetical protein OYC64_016169 [Pagothenia borchgrevinki]|uniref:DUF4371 domain-containing protein n=1 Tax=Pagothenia borchgrevinki TaxID=8213 RepID=A0ABD2HMB1_PAGBO